MNILYYSRITRIDSKKHKNAHEKTLSNTCDHYNYL